MENISDTTNRFNPEISSACCEPNSQRYAPNLKEDTTNYSTEIETDM